MPKKRRMTSRASGSTPVLSLESETPFGKWAFIVGCIIAVVSGFLSIPYLTLIMVLLGIVVGLLNIRGYETRGFLLSAIALMVAGTAGLGAIPLLGPSLELILKSAITFVAAASVVVAIRAVFLTAED